MDLKQNPFSLYDFLGYFVPGALAIYVALIAFGHSLDPSDPFWFVDTALSFERAEVYIPFILFAYVLGHILSFLSSISVEIYSIKACGYPSKYLIRLPTEGYFSVSWRKREWYTRSLLAIVLLPISLIDLVGARFGFRDLYAKSLDAFLAAALQRQVSRLIRVIGVQDEAKSTEPMGQHDYFRFAYHYAVENAPRHFPKMQNYVALYGFLRTLCFISVVVFWVVIWHIFVYRTDWLTAALLVGGSASLAFTLYTAFSKFYRRFSLEALMAVAVTMRSPTM